MAKNYEALRRLKMEVAREIGIPDYDIVNKADLPARVHGQIGGNMVKKLIEIAEQNLRY